MCDEGKFKYEMYKKRLILKKNKKKQLQIDKQRLTAIDLRSKENADTYWHNSILKALKGITNLLSE